MVHKCINLIVYFSLIIKVFIFVTNIYIYLSAPYLQRIIINIVCELIVYRLNITSSFQKHCENTDYMVTAKICYVKHKKYTKSSEFYYTSIN